MTIAERGLGGLSLLLGFIGCGALAAQDRFPDYIPMSPLEVYIREVAKIPDSSPGVPPRMSVLTRDPAGRVFLNDQRGPLYRLDLSAGAPPVATEYLDLRDYPELELRNASGEQGFQAFAFHPDFYAVGSDGYGRIYTIHSTSDTNPAPDFDPGGANSFHTLLIEWRTADPNGSTFTPVSGQPAFREVIRFKQPFSNHNAGLIAFNSTAGVADSDYGNLYIALGDGGSGNDPQENGQDPSNPYGANSANGAYGIVTTNVLAADGNPATLGEIYAYGLRNPQRFGWDTETGALFIADIGQNAIEEINLGVNGGDFGWDNREGSFPNESSTLNGFIDPVAEYDHTQPVAALPTTIPNRAVTVGEVVRGANIPGMNGQLVFGDFPTGLLFLLDVENDPLDGGQDGIRELIPLTPQGDRVQLLGLINAARTARGLNAVSRTDLRFGIDTPGQIYVLNKQDGILRELVAPPTVDITVTAEGMIGIHYTGTLEESEDLAPESFSPVTPPPESPWLEAPGEASRYYRSVITTRDALNQ